MTKMKKTQSENGFSLLELLLVVGVGAILLLAGIITYRLVTQGNSSNEGRRLLTTLKEKTQDLFRGENSYGTNDLFASLEAAGSFPTGSLNEDNTDIVNPWGGDVDVTGAGNTFTISFEGVPSDACVELGMAYTQGDVGDFVSVNVGGTDYTAPDVATLSGACNNTTNTLVWTFN